MSKLHEVLAATSDVDNRNTDVIHETAHMFHNGTAFVGNHKSFTPYDEDGLKKPTEGKNIVTTVPERLAYTGSFIANAINLFVSKEQTNASGKATADIIVNGETFNLSAIALLALEREVNKIKNLVAHIPVFDASINWIDNSDERADTYKTEEQLSYSTEATIEVVVVAEATKEHKAQLREAKVTRQVGVYKSVNKSGMISSATKATMTAKVNALLTEIKTARSRANECEAVLTNIGNEITKYLFS